MIQAVPKLLTFDEFLNWDDGTDRTFELIDGVPMPISAPNANHEDVADNLCYLLYEHCLSLNLPYVPKRLKQVRLNAEPGEKEKSRKADIVVFAKSEWQRMKASPSPAAAYTTPPMIIEIVSTNWRDDYGIKLVEYEALGVPEYWVVDYAALGAIRYIGNPKQPTLSVYQLVDGEYQVRQFRGSDRIESPTFPALNLTAEQVFQAQK
ncbi:MAG: Uma2 family endonuclease [Microcoleus sp. CSU_2_2]|nr:Uma2 family endonuclease [Microcoleus sp. SU_5_3]NJS13218.1 Uma2 family endonuclease [Microcoleus sp. CSU_2_2]